MKKKRWLLLLTLLLVFCAGGTAIRACAAETVSTEAEKPPEFNQTFHGTISGGGLAVSTSRPKIRSITLDRFPGSYGAEFGSGTYEKAAYDEMVNYYVTGKQSGTLQFSSLTIPFCGEGSVTDTPEYQEAEDTLEYAVGSAFSALLYDYPELYWAYEISYEWNIGYVNGNKKPDGSYDMKIYNVKMHFKEIYENASGKQGAFDTAVSSAVSAVAGMRTDSSPYQTLKAIHDYVCDRITYPSNYSLTNSALVNPAYHSAAAMFVDGGIGVCECYAKSFMILCKKFGIPAILVAGNANGAHMWNYVQLNGRWYAVDATWDDVAGLPADYTYFLIGSDTAVPGGTFGTTRVLNTRFNASENSMNFIYPILNGTAYQIGEGTAKEHNWVLVSETKPTCTAAGVFTYRCLECGELSHSETAALGHSYHGRHYIYNDDATVFQDGTKTPVCDNGCGTTKTPVTAYGTKLKPTIKLNVSSLVLMTGQSTKALKVSGLARGDSIMRWESLTPKLVKVSASGKITAKKKTGTAKVRITLQSGLQKTVKVKVQSKPVQTKKIQNVPKELSLGRGESWKLAPACRPIATKQKVLYRSSNQKVASVSKSGRIIAKRKGRTTITVTSGTKKVKCKIIVK